MSVYPYLFFSGTAREAMTRYQTVLGGELEIMAASDHLEDVHRGQTNQQLARARSVQHSRGPRL